MKNITLVCFAVAIPKSPVELSRLSSSIGLSRALAYLLVVQTNFDLV
jgi:hypothetical protein